MEKPQIKQILKKKNIYLYPLLIINEREDY